MSNSTVSVNAEGMSGFDLSAIFDATWTAYRLARVRAELRDLSLTEQRIGQRAKLARSAVASAMGASISMAVPGVSPQVLQAYVDEFVGAASETMVELAPNLNRKNLAALVLAGTLELGDLERAVKHVTPVQMEHLVPIEGARVTAFHAELEAAKVRVAELHAHAAKSSHGKGWARWIGRMFSGL